MTQSVIDCSKNRLLGSAVRSFEFLKKSQVKHENMAGFFPDPSLHYIASAKIAGVVVERSNSTKSRTAAQIKGARLPHEARCAGASSPVLFYCRAVQRPAATQLHCHFAGSSLLYSSFFTTRLTNFSIKQTTGRYHMCTHINHYFNFPLSQWVKTIVAELPSGDANCSTLCNSTIP